MDELIFSPDIGQADFDALFTSTNKLRIVMLVSDTSVVAGPEQNPRAKGPMNLQLTIGGSVRLVPIEVASRIRAKNGGVVFWRTTTGDSGRFFFYRHAPPVFEEEDLVRRKA
jgi:hypothetical protein